MHFSLHSKILTLSLHFSLCFVTKRSDTVRFSLRSRTVTLSLPLSLYLFFGFFVLLLVVGGGVFLRFVVVAVVCFGFYTCDVLGDDLWDGTKVATADADHADGRGQNVVDVAAKQAAVFPQHGCCSPHLKACRGPKKAVTFRSKCTPDLITRSTFFFLLLKWKCFTPQNMPKATVLTLVLSLAVTTITIFIFLPLLRRNQMFKYKRLVGFLLSKRRRDFQHVQWS